MYLESNLDDMAWEEFYISLNILKSEGPWGCPGINPQKWRWGERRRELAWEYQAVMWPLLLEGDVTRA